jgi:outer membrane receptor protein involved in Fe transport
MGETFQMTKFKLEARSLAGASALALAMALSSQAFAQAAADNSNVEEVVVTGSRIARAGFQAPTPTTVVSTAILNTRAETNIGGILNTLPAFKADYSPAASGPRSFGSPGATFANLRSLGSQRTLALVDGRRLTPSSIEGQADLNLIPSLLIQNVDVVTGGASAAYGSDAVAGVVNIRLKKNLEGFIGNASYGQTKYDDYKDTFFALAWGGSFAGGKGHVMIGGEYDRNKGAGTAYSRPWGQEEWGFIPGPAGGPSNILVQNRHGITQAPGGLITSGPLKGTVFNPDGTTRQYNYGSPISGSFQVGGEGAGETYTSLLMNPLKRRNVLGRVDYTVSEALAVYFEASWAKSSSLSKGSSPSDTTTTTLPSIRIENPYLPAAVRARMQAANVTTINVGRRNDDLGIYMADVDTEVQRYVFGADGSIGGGWRWDTFVQYGKTDYSGGVLNARKQANWRLGTDVVANGSTGITVPGVAVGAPVCRSSTVAATAGNGCVPINIFGNGNVSDAARAYVMGNESYELEYEQTVAAFNVHGTPFSTWAGEVAVAAGIEHRSEKTNAVTDPVSAVGGWHTGNQRPISGKFHVTEGYIEALTPLLRDQAFAKLLEVDTAVRLTDYSTSGRVTTWKIGLNYEVNDSIRFRATRSRDIRAANMSELFAQGVSAQQPIQDPISNLTVSTPNIAIGNPLLTPEKADTWTYGVVLKPSFIPGLDISVDRYDIQLKDAIATIAGQRIVDYCAAGQSSYCGYISRQNNSPTGTITQIINPRFNIANINATGWDIEARYRHDLDFINAPGAISLAFIGTRTDKIKVDDLATVVNYAGDIGNSGRGAYGQPKWRWTYMTTYDLGPFSATGTVRYIGGGNFNNTWGPAQIADNHVKSATYFDLSMSYNLVSRGSKSVQLYGIVQNMFNKAPSVVPTQVSQTNPVIFDVLGRQYRAGVRFTF